MATTSAERARLQPQARIVTKGWLRASMRAIDDKRRDRTHLITRSPSPTAARPGRSTLQDRGDADGLSLQGREPHPARARRTAKLVTEDVFAHPYSADKVGWTRSTTIRAGLRIILPIVREEETMTAFVHCCRGPSRSRACWRRARRPMSGTRRCVAARHRLHFLDRLCRAGCRHLQGCRSRREGQVHHRYRLEQRGDRRGSHRFRLRLGRDAPRAPRPQPAIIGIAATYTHTGFWSCSARRSPMSGTSIRRRRSRSAPADEGAALGVGAIQAIPHAYLSSIAEEGGSTREGHRRRRNHADDTPATLARGAIDGFSGGPDPRAGPPCRHRRRPRRRQRRSAVARPRRGQRAA